MNNSAGVLTLAQDAIMVALYLSAPLLLAALVVGLVISVLQAATQINEMTLAFVPKLIAIFMTAVIAGPWMITMMTDYIKRLFGNIPFMLG
ncbi:flagellar biosynthesis protein FliQ [Pigmentiphaga litoralis]|uniref:Flagellar biosynthetic protein FliQ n=1 Tax=Pigmentiphaga litoralis TaxID=516702 RepID=A0A7Y9LQ90_9BURK|nr:flagellar biosynthesis protein FliQ [Pigmentiphaga litoralis]NYE26852.1 flagellar biosynthetic protein FliQ [Pigmentiphaga litoralis]NYE85738.1 flagellar biosynthetic protein FliQ [Pigmentiphaga litoralis]